MDIEDLAKGAAETLGGNQPLRLVGDGSWRWRLVGICHDTNSLSHRAGQDDPVTMSSVTGSVVLKK